jgi:hypothetical protein
VVNLLRRKVVNLDRPALVNLNRRRVVSFTGACNKLNGKVSDIPFFISLSSWLHGLNTTLGQSFFESVAHILCEGEKKEFIPSKGSLLKVSQSQKNNIADIITELKNGSKPPDLQSESPLVFIKDEPTIDANSFTADVFMDDVDRVCAVELKTVKPNAGEMRGEKQKILEAKASLFHKYPGKRIEYYIGFPFDPTSDTAIGSDKTRFLSSIIDGTKYFDLRETLVSSELWDFLSGEQNTMEQLLEIVNTIATPQFQEIYIFLNDHSNRQSNSETYLSNLKTWNLFQELFLVENDAEILRKINGESKRVKIYNQSVLKEGEYNFERYRALCSVLST